MAQANDWFDEWFTQSLQKIQGSSSSSLSNINVKQSSMHELP